MKRVRVKIFGDVQGVGFRHSTYFRAIHLGVKGWVRNNYQDGTVEAVFEGEDAEVAKMVEFCKHGPPSANVEHIEIFEENFKNEFKSFEIL
jgi:acylphosphatase